MVKCLTLFEFFYNVCDHNTQGNLNSGYYMYVPVTLVEKKKGTSMSYVNVLHFINYALYSLQVMDQQDTLNIHLGDLDITSEDFWLDEVDGMHVQNLQDGGCC